MRASVHPLQNGMLSMYLMTRCGCSFLGMPFACVFRSLFLSHLLLLDRLYLADTTQVDGFVHFQFLGEMNNGYRDG